jgi:hypothetical protein
LNDAVGAFRLPFIDPFLSEKPRERKEKARVESVDLSIAKTDRVTR